MYYVSSYTAKTLETPKLQSVNNGWLSKSKWLIWDLCFLKGCICFVIHPHNCFSLVFICIVQWSLLVKFLFTRLQLTFMSTRLLILDPDHSSLLIFLIESTAAETQCLHFVGKWIPIDLPPLQLKQRKHFTSTHSHYTHFLSRLPVLLSLHYFIAGVSRRDMCVWRLRSSFIWFNFLLARVH